MCAVRQEVLGRTAQPLFTVQHDGELAACLGQARLQFNQVPVRHALFHGVARQAAQAIAGRHDALDRLVAAQFEADTHLRQVVEQPVIRGLACAGAVFPHHPGGLGQLVERCAALRQGMVRRREDHHLIVPPRLHQQVGMRLRTLHKADVDVQCCDRIDDFTGIANAQMDLALGVQLRPPRHQAGQQVLADREAGRHPQRRCVLVREQRLQFGRLINEDLGLGQQRAPVFVELQAPADAVKQFDAQRGLEIRQRGAGRRLRARDAIGRRTCAAAARRGQKDLQLTQVHAQALER